MKTVVIKVGELQSINDSGVEKNVYPVTLRVYEGGVLPVGAGGDDFIPADFLAGQPAPPGRGVPLTEAEVKGVLARSGSSLLFEHVGQCLYRVLFGGKVGVAWDALHARLRQGEGFRTFLDVEPRSLSELPWELLTTPNVQRKRLFLDPSRPFVRGRSTAFEQPRPVPEWPLRALLVVGSEPNDDVIDAREEVAAILGALRQLGRTAHAEVLLRPSKQKVVDRYRDFMPHIFHFIGHGGELPGQRPRLKLYDENLGKTMAWTVDDIQHDLNGCHPASLAFINACRTTNAAGGGPAGDEVTPDSSLSIIEAFAESGISAVLGMMGNVTEDAAQEFALRFYTALAQGKTVDVALCEARQGVNLLPGLGVTHRHWAVASLSLSAVPENVLAVEPPIPSEVQQEIRDDTELKKLASFFDRQDQRFSLVRLDPYREPAQNKSLQLVYGESSVGKTSLVQLFMECCAMRGRKFLRVNMRGPTLNFAAALCRISMGDSFSGTLLEKPLQPRAAFNLFHWELPYLLKGESPPPMKLPKSGVIDAPEDRKLEGLVHDYQSRRFPRGGVHREQDARDNSVHLKRIFSNFAEALKKVAEGMPLIIALDHLTIDATDFENYFVKYLLLPVKRHELSPVRMILVLSGDNISDYNLRDKESPLYIGNGVSIPKFRKDEFEFFAYEFFRFNRMTRARATKTIDHYLDTPWVQEGWAPGRLYAVLELDR
jgi:hypothetical protein